MQTPKQAGRPAKDGITVKTNLATLVHQLVTNIAERMTSFTEERRTRSRVGLTLTPAGHRSWDRSSVIASLVSAAAPQFAETVLGVKYAVRLGTACPLCWGHVDGPHAPACGYFGPLAERDPDFDNRLRAALFRAGDQSRFRILDGKVAEVWVSSTLIEPPAAAD